MTELGTKPVLTTMAVEQIVTAGRAHAEQLGCAVTIVVVDDTLTPRQLLRLDDADVLTVGLATGKARLSAANGMPTAGWRDLFVGDQLLAASIATTLGDVLRGAVFFAGGLPIRVGTHVVGGVGVSGGREDQDAAVAGAALHGLPQAESV